MKTRQQYLQTLCERYLKVQKRQKSSILDEFCRNTGQNRKYVIRKISRLASTEPRPPRKRAPYYGQQTARALETLWKMFDYPCGQRLKPLLETELDRLVRLREVKISAETVARLRSISPATIDRLLRPNKAAWKLHHPSGAKRPGLIAKKIPLRMGTGNNVRIGFVDMDLVLHCGSSTAGEYGHSLSTLDLGSAWWEGEIAMGRAQRRIFSAIMEIESRSPFPWKSIHSDNDNAFINGQLYDYAEQRGYGFTRSRPYCKNDNPHIEQKNFTHVRKPLGYLRYDTPEELALIQDLYRHELRLFKNFFQPVMMLSRKARVSGRPKRTYSPAKTPYHRLIESGQLSPEKTRELKALYQSLNPAELKRQIDRKLARLYDLYRKKKKRPISINPYKKQVPSMVTFFVSEQSQLGLPDYMS